MGSDLWPAVALVDVFISIHTPRMGSDFFNILICFLLYISIHTPRMGSDWIKVMNVISGNNFNPHSPHGE